jgi:hypothetical protein
MRSLVHSLKKVLCLLNSRLLSRTIRTLFPSMNTVSHTDGALKDVVDTGVGASPRQLIFIGTDLCNSDYKKNSIDRSKYILCTCSRQKKHRLFYHNRFTIPARIHRVGYAACRT